MKSQFYVQTKGVFRYISLFIFSCLLSCHVLYKPHSLTMQWYDTNLCCRREDQKIKELFDAIETLKDEFESIARPIFEIETPSQISETPSKSKNNKSPSTISEQTAETPKSIKEVIDSSMIKEKKTLDSKAELTELDSQLGNDSRSDSAEEINDWEFDALEKD